MILMLLRLLLFLALGYAALRFVRGLMSGFSGGNLPRRERRGPQVPTIDEADIIDAEFTDVTEPTEPPGSNEPRS